MNVPDLRGWWRRRNAKDESPFDDEFMARLRVEQKAVRRRHRLKVRPQRRRLALKVRDWPLLNFDDEHTQAVQDAADDAVASRGWADTDHQTRPRQAPHIDRPVFYRSQ